jgi:hypothetical protein
MSAIKSKAKIVKSLVIAAVCLPLIFIGAMAAEKSGFAFSTDRVTSVVDPKQFIGEVIGAPQA